MKNLLFLSVCLLTAIPTFGQKTIDYPFELEKSGSGDRAIVLIPGFACSGEVWAETIKIYEKDFSCYTLTMEGFAGAQPNPSPSFEKWKTGIADFIKKEKLEKPILIGHSMGGGLAMAIAADYPELVKKIIIIDAMPCLAALTDPNFKQQQNDDCSAMVNRITELPKEQFYKMQQTSMPRFVQNTEMLETVVNWSVTSDRQTFALMYCDFLNTDLRGKVKNIQCPALILLEPQFKNMEQAVENQYKNLKTADLRYASKGLHFIMYDDKEWYFDQLANFLTHD